MTEALVRLDHLVLAGPDLAVLSAEVSGRLGVRPAVGGRHVGRGTRNELAGLGPDGPGAGRSGTRNDRQNEMLAMTTPSQKISDGSTMPIMPNVTGSATAAI